MPCLACTLASHRVSACTSLDDVDKACSGSDNGVCVQTISDSHNSLSVCQPFVDCSCWPDKMGCSPSRLGLAGKKESIIDRKLSEALNKNRNRNDRKHHTLNELLLQFPRMKTGAWCERGQSMLYISTVHAHMHMHVTMALAGMPAKAKISACAARPGACMLPPCHTSYLWFS